MSLLSALCCCCCCRCCSRAFSGFPCGRCPGGQAAPRIGEFFISSNYIKPDERLGAKAAPVKEKKQMPCRQLTAKRCGRAEVSLLKVKRGKGWRGDIRGAVRETGNCSGQHIRERRRVREIHCARLCPRPVVCLHQSSAKRADKTEEDGEAERRRRRRV